MPRAKHYGRGRAQKGLVTGELEGGAHWHRLDRASGTTDVDGGHTHVFKLPGGLTIVTSEDGTHRHDLDDGFGEEHIYGGAHVHSVTMPDGQVVRTEVDGHHSHGTQTESTTLDGMHSHVLVLPDGSTIESEDVKGGGAEGPMARFAAEAWTAAKSDGAMQFFNVGADIDLLSDVVDVVGEDPFLIVAEDTPFARDALAKIGSVYRHASGDWGIVVGTNVPTDCYVVPASKASTVCESSQDVDVSPLEDAEKSAVTNVASTLDSVGRWIVAKDEQEERFILGIVAEPDEIDTQQDTIKSHTIRTAAHKFMEDFRNIGLQHQTFVNGRVQILESHVTINDQNVNGQLVKAGSWILGVRVKDDRIWRAVKDGSFTGFSLGGTAIREPLDLSRT